MEVPRVISVNLLLESLVWNIHMSWAATDVSDWLLQLALACCINSSRRSVTHQLLSAYSTIMADKVIDSLVNRQV